MLSFRYSKGSVKPPERSLNIYRERVSKQSYLIIRTLSVAGIPMDDKTTREEKERLMARLALAATNLSDVETCPSDKKLAAFIDNRLRGTERQAMLAHFNRCRQCYQHWLEIAVYLKDVAESTPEPKTQELP